MIWFHAHVYFNTDDDSFLRAEEFHRLLKTDPSIRLEFVGDLERRIVGPHPKPQFEIHFRGEELWSLLPKLHVERLGLSVLIHPVTLNDHEDHFGNAIWLGEPFRLDATKLDPPGQNKAFLRLGLERRL
jgi:aromatic ring-cleaving dioxygenase